MIDTVEGQEGLDSDRQISRGGSTPLTDCHSDASDDDDDFDCHKSYGDEQDETPTPQTSMQQNKPSN